MTAIPCWEGSSMSNASAFQLSSFLDNFNIFFHALSILCVSIITTMMTSNIAIAKRFNLAMLLELVVSISYPYQPLPATGGRIIVDFSMATP